MRTAVAVFVKTPGLSPVKTRLAKYIGSDAAESFFIRCVQTIEKTLVDLLKISRGKIQPFWAVGEREGLSNGLWKNFSTMYTGDGSLGDRQSTVYSTLLDEFESVILLGADSPQITPKCIIETAEILNKKKDFVIGPALDGGYYLFGGNQKIPRDIWTSVPYSVNETGDRLVQSLKPIGSIQTIDKMVDVDTIEDLDILKDELSKTSFLHHNALESWMDNNIFNTQLFESQSGCEVCD